MYNDSVRGKKVAVFIDYGCMYQRTAASGITFAQMQSFGVGLGGINVLYANTKTLKVLCPNSHLHCVEPGGRASYGDSGWPFFELGVSGLITAPEKIIDLTRALEWLVPFDENEDDEGLRREMSFSYLVEYIQRHALALLPLDPNTFSKEVRTRTFTHGSDCDFVNGKYGETVTAILEPLRELQLPNRSLVGPADWVPFFDATLPMCKSLITLNLSQNQAIENTTREPIAAAAAGTLEFLVLSNSPGVGGTLEPLRLCLKLEKLFVDGCVRLEGDVDKVHDNSQTPISLSLIHI